MRRSARFWRGVILSSVIPFALVLFLVAPSVVNYTPYPMAWDDVYFLHRAACFHDAVYRLDLRGMAECYSILSKSPVMTFFMLPWGPAASGEPGVPLALLSLAILIWIFVVLIYRAAVASGASVWALTAAAMAVWLNPFIGMYGGSFLSDMLVSWCTLLLVLLIPLELSTHPGSASQDVKRGLLWGFVITVGVLAKVTFIFFLAVTGAAVLWIRFRRQGVRCCARAAATALICSLPAALIWALFGRNFISHATGFSFGGLSKFYAVEGGTPLGYLKDYLSNCSWACLPMLAVIVYFFWRLRRSEDKLLRLLPLGLMVFYLALCAFSPNGDFRFALPVMIGLPFVLAVVPAGGKDAVPGAALIGYGLLAGVLCAIPMLGRADLAPVRYAERLLQTIGKPNTRILLATESPQLNIETFLLAKQFLGSRAAAVRVDTLVYDALNGRSIYDSYHRMESADYILFHKPPLSTEPKWANAHAAEFYKYAAAMADPAPAPSDYMNVMKVRPLNARTVPEGEYPELTSLTTDPAPLRPGLFHWDLQGRRFTPGTRVVITGFGCEAGCTLNPESVSFKGPGELSGIADLTNGRGVYQFQAANGPTSSKPITVQMKR